ncbi:hypothetical protein CBM2599_A180146 [Cupriavidus taiwanensis]|uniref:Uncharacterized protein n=1 Tax=Cupriavidus taiwanensis TaxID=164546 RepID=A0A375CYS6_9BURK|nr:hypothetical protein CBM2599_A180146 [Cupriavidus taiwanensis]SOY86965.1 hypothetical protein CBM2600_A160148 [Cupriavidus taiwanensis]SPD66034.1 protein of unknown function [Cupriavidus taiwanensis]
MAGQAGRIHHPVGRYRVRETQDPGDVRRRLSALARQQKAGREAGFSFLRSGVRPGDAGVSAG